MREYGQVQCAYWQISADECWSADARLLGLYLLTGPHSNGLGAFRITDGNIKDDLDWGSTRSEAAFDDLKAIGFATRYGRVVVIHKFLRWNAIANSKVAMARIREWQSLPKGSGKDAAAKELVAFGRHIPDLELKAIRTRSETVSDRDPNQNQTKPNQNKPEQQEPNGSSAKPDKPPSAVASVQVLSGDDYPITAEYLAQLSDAYPAVDVLSEIKRMRVWLDANPKNRKTRSGIKRFISTWLSKSQNDSGRVQAAAANKRRSAA